MDKRNQYMVDHAGCLVAVWFGIVTGTGRTVKYAEQLGREVFCNAPENMAGEQKRR